MLSLHRGHEREDEAASGAGGTCLCVRASERLLTALPCRAAEKWLARLGAGSLRLAAAKRGVERAAAPRASQPVVP